jgi:tetratricopeptide (TPR) repeat protein
LIQCKGKAIGKPKQDGFSFQEGSSRRNSAINSYHCNVFSILKKVVQEHLVLVFALGLTFLIYSKLLFYGHISWDDPEMVFKNKAVKEFNVVAFFSQSFVGNYLPFTMLLHAKAWWIFGNYNGGHHVINLLLHLLNGILVFQITNHLFKNKALSDLTAVVFLLHPLQIESVAWISELKNVLSAFFYFASIRYYLLYLENAKIKLYLLAFVWFLAGCLSKSSVVILPLSLMGIDVLLKQNFRFSYLFNKIPFLLVSLVFGIINIKTQMADQFINYSHAFPYHERLGYAGYALIKYLILFVFPANLSVLYPYPSNKAFALVLGFVFLAILSFITFYNLKKRKYAIPALFFLCVSGLILVLQFVPFGEVLFADRYMYVPLVYFSMLILFVCREPVAKIKYLSYIIIGALAVVTFLRLEVWKSSVILYTDILKKTPDSFVALNSLGSELMMQNEDKKALAYLEKSVKVSPENYKGHYNKGLLLLKTNKPKEAIKSFNKAITLFDYHKAYIGRASAYFMLKDIPKAMEDANYVLKNEPNHAKALFVLGNCYNSLNQLDTAISFYHKCIAISTDDGDFYFRRAIAYGKKQDFVRCLEDLNQSIVLNPLNFEAFYWRGVAKVNLKQNPCTDLRIAARNNIEPAVQAYNKFCR